jgi:signal transduction histidine kinase
VRNEGTQPKEKRAIMGKNRQQGTRGKEECDKISARQQQALHLQSVYEAVMSLNAAITRLPESFPERIAALLGEGSWLFSPPAVFVAQQLADVTRQVLGCERVSLLGLVGMVCSLRFVAGSGFTPKEEACERTHSGQTTLSQVLGEEHADRLLTRQEVVLPGESLHLPREIGAVVAKSVLLIVPLFINSQAIGILCVIKRGKESTYTPEEVELAKVVATQATLITECLYCIYAGAERRTREEALYELNHLCNNFLILAGHELRTPLTGILGNLQLARRRLETLQQQVAAQDASLKGPFAKMRQPLASAERSAWLQQRMINAIIDDARIQSNQLQLNVQPCDLLDLLRVTIATQQQQTPERTIILESETAQRIPLLVDSERMSSVVVTYLANALLSSTAEQPVRVRVTREEGMARVAVHNEGPGLSIQEQEHLWERFYRAKGSAVQHELDLSLGLGFYLCRALVERHGGQTGVESSPGHGATIWFTLPIASEKRALSRSQSM